MVTLERTAHPMRFATTCHPRFPQIWWGITDVAGGFATHAFLGYPLPP